MPTKTRAQPQRPSKPPFHLTLEHRGARATTLIADHNTLLSGELLTLIVSDMLTRMTDDLLNGMATGTSH
jgi:hypothetical protein